MIGARVFFLSYSDSKIGTTKANWAAQRFFVPAVETRCPAIMIARPFLRKILNTATPLASRDALKSICLRVASRRRFETRNRLGVRSRPSLNLEEPASLFTAQFVIRWNHLSVFLRSGMRFKVMFSPYPTLSQMTWRPFPAVRVVVS